MIYHRYIAPLQNAAPTPQPVYPGAQPLTWAIPLMQQPAAQQSTSQYAIPLDDMALNSVKWGKTVDLGKYSFTEAAFQKLAEQIEAHKPKKIILTKNFLSEAIISHFDTLVNKNTMKGTKLVDTRGERIGSLQTDWSDYNRQKEEAGVQPLNKTTQVALMALPEAGPREVIDFGAGTGNETLQIVNRFPNVHVTAIDGDEEATDILRKNIPAGKEDQVTIYTGPFVTYRSAKKVDLLYSSFSIPYRPEEDFPKMWKHTVSLIKEGGILAGHFFGKPGRPKESMTYHTESSLKELLEKDFKIILFLEGNDGIELYGDDDENGKMIPEWGDLYHVVAKKK